MHPYPKHLDTFEYCGPHRYFLTFCTHERQPLFTTTAHVVLVEEYFLQGSTSTSSSANGYRNDMDTNTWFAGMRPLEPSWYVLENPIRAGLVQTLADYPFIGSSEYTLEQLLEYCSSSG